MFLYHLAKWLPKGWHWIDTSHGACHANNRTFSLYQHCKDGPKKQQTCVMHWWSSEVFFVTKLQGWAYKSQQTRVMHAKLRTISVNHNMRFAWPTSATHFWCNILPIATYGLLKLTMQLNMRWCSLTCCHRLWMPTSIQSSVIDSELTFDSELSLEVVNVRC